MVSEIKYEAPILEKMYNFNIDPNTGEVMEFGQTMKNGLSFTGESTLRGEKKIYTASRAMNWWEVGFDQNGEMWLKDLAKVGDWKKASDSQFKDLQNRDDFKSLKETGKDIMEKRADIEQKEKENIENKKISTKDKLAQKEADYQSAYNMMYEMVWTLLDLTLSEPINEAIADQCKSDADKSYPATDTTTDTGGGISGGAGTGGDPCTGITSNIYNAQFVSKTPLDNGNCDYRVTYGISACGSAVDYASSISGTQDSDPLESNSVSLGQTISRSNVIELQICTHQSICLTTNDGHNQCYPPLP